MPVYGIVEERERNPCICFNLYLCAIALVYKLLSEEHGLCVSACSNLWKNKF